MRNGYGYETLTYRTETFFQFQASDNEQLSHSCKYLTGNDSNWKLGIRNVNFHNVRWNLPQLLMLFVTQLNSNVRTGLQSLKRSNCTIKLYSIPRFILHEEFMYSSSWGESTGETCPLTVALTTQKNHNLIAAVMDYFVVACRECTDLVQEKFARSGHTNDFTQKQGCSKGRLKACSIVILSKSWRQYWTIDPPS